MSEHPILFQDWGIRSIRARIKTQTRRIIKDATKKCPYGAAGDYLWTREAWKIYDEDGHGEEYAIVYRADEYGGKSSEVYWVAAPKPDWGKYCMTGEDGEFEEDKNWRPSIFLPRWASRIDLLVKFVGAQRIQDISEEDARAEGIIKAGEGMERDWGAALWLGYDRHDVFGCLKAYATAKRAFATLWDSINATPKPVMRRKKIAHYTSYPWEDIQETREHRGLPWYVIGNPHVWAVGFELVDREEGKP